MPSQNTKPYLPRSRFLALLGSSLGVTAVGAAWWAKQKQGATASFAPIDHTGGSYEPFKKVDTSGVALVASNLDPWPPTASLKEIAAAFPKAIATLSASIERDLADSVVPADQKLMASLAGVTMLVYQGHPERAYERLKTIREQVQKSSALVRDWLFTVIYLQGVVGLRQGENENCVLCIGNGACILPIAPSAVHQKTDGSRRAVSHFTEYLEEFPDDLEIRWLLNLAHMTLGEHPAGVAPKFLISLEHYLKSEFNIGKFRDIAALAGLNRLNMGGGAIMDDFDNDGFLDIAISSWDANQAMALYRNKGDGTFEDRTAAAGLADQLGGLYCVQADYNNDGNLDILIVRGAWLKIPMRPSLLRNNGDGTFTDVTEQAGLLHAVNSISASWADYDNDGHLDLLICCEAQPNLLYHNNGDGTFTEVAAKAGVAGKGGTYKGAAWIDSNNNGLPDLFLNNLNGPAELYRNNGDGTFTDVTEAMGIDGPRSGFSCWAWDYDNDGFLDIFATSYHHTTEGVVQGMLGQPHHLSPNKLFRNKGGKGFEDVTKEAGLDMVFETMGSNFGDIDNDGYLDIYLGTGDPSLTSLVPNRLLKNVEGKRFVEITGATGTGNLQKGHGVAFGDWDNDGSLDLFIEMGGAVPADSFRNILFQNPGQGNAWLTVKLIGVKTNRSAIGARIKVVTSGAAPLTVHRLVSSGSSFGANPLQQTIGLGKASGTVTLEIHWPTSGTTQTFSNVALNQFIEVTEFSKDYRPVQRKRVPTPSA